MGNIIGAFISNFLKIFLNIMGCIHVKKLRIFSLFKKWRITL